MAKGLKLKLRRFYELIRTFVEIKWKKLERGPCWPSLIALNITVLSGLMRIKTFKLLKVLEIFLLIKYFLRKDNRFYFQTLLINRLETRISKSCLKF